jgi:hypothetical protein
VVVYKDPRIDLLIKKQIDINEETTRRTGELRQGFAFWHQLNDRKVFDAKARIYQLYPDLKLYLLYQAPFYKLKVGNFKPRKKPSYISPNFPAIFLPDFISSVTLSK